MAKRFTGRRKFRDEQHPPRSGRSEMQYQQDTSAYDDDFRAVTRPEESHSGQKRYAAANRQAGREHQEDIDHVRYQRGEENLNAVKLSRKGRWTEDASFDAYRESLRDSDAMKNAREDIGHYQEGSSYHDDRDASSDFNALRAASHRRVKNSAETKRRNHKR